MLLDEQLTPYLDQPREVALETYSMCNAACTFCPYPTLDRIGTKMPMALIEKLIAEMAEWREPFFFSPFKVNEPLLDKRVYEICRQVTDNTLGVVRMFSNGSTLNLSNIEKIANMDRVVQLWVSLNDYRPDEYKDLMNLDFEHTAKNLDVLHESDFPYPVMLSTVGYPNEDFRRYCFNRWPDFESMAIRDGGWLGYTDAVGDIPDTYCWRWWEMSIMATGKASLCCMDGVGEYGFGDTNTETLLEIYAKTRKWRDGISRKEAGNPCNRCWN
jgi:hypothetical protein